MKTKHKAVPVFLETHLPNMASHCLQSSCGFSVYRGVLVQWDEDQDRRVLTVLDEMPAECLDLLVAVQEHEGCISFVWNRKEPKRYAAGGSVDGEGDEWHIDAATVLP